MSVELKSESFAMESLWAVLCPTCKEGTIVAFDALTGRYHVRLGDGGVRRWEYSDIHANSDPMMRWKCPQSESTAGPFGHRTWWHESHRPRSRISDSVQQFVN